jgi:hypothetical protein
VQAADRAAVGARATLTVGAAESAVHDVVHLAVILDGDPHGGAAEIRSGGVATVTLEA